MPSTYPRFASSTAIFASMLTLVAAACDAPDADGESETGVSQHPIERYAPDLPREIRRVRMGDDTLAYEVVDGMVVLGGDILIGPVEDFERQFNQPEGTRSVFKLGQRWPMPIRYSFDNNTPAATKAAVEEAMQALVAESCADISFARCKGTCPLPRIKFHYDGKGCSSYVGAQFLGNPIQLDTWCDGLNAATTIRRQQEVGSIKHELMHALGVRHEQTRCDRDAHVTVNANNIDTDVCPLSAITAKHCFLHSDFGSYDFSSIMHYRSNACAIDSTIPTIDSGNATNNAQMGNRISLSTTDGAALRQMYGAAYGGCPGGGSSSSSGGGSCNNATCATQCGGPGLGACTGSVCNCF